MIVSKIFNISQKRPATYNSASEIAATLYKHREAGVLGIVDCEPMVSLQKLKEGLSFDIGGDDWESRKTIVNNVMNKYPKIGDWIGPSEVVLNSELELIGGRHKKMRHMQRYYSADQLNKYVISPATEHGAKDFFKAEVWSPLQAIINLVAVISEDATNKLVFYPTIGDEKKPYYMSKHSLPTVAACALPNMYTIKTTPPKYVMAEFFLSMKLVSPYVFDYMRGITVPKHHVEKIIEFCEEMVG